jgi:hypothetical protein
LLVEARAAPADRNVVERLDDSVACHDMQVV